MKTAENKMPLRTPRILFAWRRRFGSTTNALWLGRRCDTARAAAAVFCIDATVDRQRRRSKRRARHIAISSGDSDRFGFDAAGGRPRAAASAKFDWRRRSADSRNAVGVRVHINIHRDVRPVCARVRSNDQRDLCEKRRLCSRLCRFVCTRARITSTPPLNGSGVHTQATVTAAAA